MKCPYCGATLLNNARFCEECGAVQSNYSDAAPDFGQQAQYQQPQFQQQPQYGQSRAGMGVSMRSGEPQSPIYTDFANAVKLFFHNWNNFSGRSTRSEFWYAYLLQMMIGVVTARLPLIISLAASIAMFVPFLAVSVRRLHDIGKSGWWYLIAFTCVGAFVLIYWYSKPGDPLSNQYGPSAEELDIQNPRIGNNFNNTNNFGS